MAGRENERTHAGYFDYLRLIAAFSGVFMHTAAGGLRKEVNARQELLNAAAGAAFTAVPLLWMTSGCLLLSSERTADVRFCRANACRAWKFSWPAGGGTAHGYFPEGFGGVRALTAPNLVARYLAAKTLAAIKPLCFLLTGSSCGPCRSCNWAHTARGVQKRFKKSPAGGPSAQNPHLTSRLFCACFYTGRRARDSAHGAEKGGDE